MAQTFDRQARKEQLAEAVWQVILDKGVGAVSIRTVADQAGVVVGSLRYVFPTRTELLNFSAELMVARATERALATPWDDDPQEYAFQVIAQFLPLEPESRAELEVNLALVGESAAQPALIDIRNHAHEQLRAAFVRLVQLLTGSAEGDGETLASARRLHALVDGLALHLLHTDPTDAQGAEWALVLVRQEIARISAEAERAARPAP
ncbi:TetR/AcrR family transcriptional regulator [Microbacterium marinilacus]|uniref:TetR/AcrR family transcriptional regulator n=1 Tax=Microbacterium marinilacus TaxID=415209 RepID=A0ABP7BMY5_9MICO|nr:TetR family transcriptional regulator C-terminal domain-containing protein [Microbacterium marinilacus]MBY0688386.1 TetR family transcriptional regulator [Microbacterium marinilacus]